MAQYVEVNGVRMWYDERGGGEPLVLLHGGLTDSRDFAGNLDALAGRFRVFLPERRGHGHTADVAGPITLEVMARDVVAFVDTVVGGPVRLVGYSAGAAVALRVAAARPDLVGRLVLISGAFHRDGMIVRPTADAEVPAQLVAAYAEVSPDGAGHFPVVIGKIVQSVAEEPGMTPAELGAVGCRTLVMAGDDDIVTLEHTLALYRGLGDAELAVVPGASHLLLHERPELCARLVTDFLTTGPAPTVMPIRRRRRDLDGGDDAALPAGLPKPALRALTAAGYTRLDQLAGVSEAELRRLHGVGPKALDRLRRALAARELSLAADLG